jgi:D-3-phosphoglycerate dehydrogenase
MHKLELPETLLAVAAPARASTTSPPTNWLQRASWCSTPPGANANAVRELAVAALLLSSRKILKGIEWVRTLKGMGADVPKLVEKGKSKFVGPELRERRWA